MSNPKVLIIGGGVAGPALAFWLARVDYDITIVERFETLRAQGQQIDLRGQGVRVMRKMGIEEDVRKVLVQEPGIDFVTEDGKVYGSFPANLSGKGSQSASSEFEIMRGDLSRLLYRRTKDTTRYIFGTTVEKLDQDGNHVIATFSSGEQERFDLVVGADGQSSRTRRRLMGFPDTAPDPVFPLGIFVCYFTIPRVKTDSAWVKVCQFSGRLVSVRGADSDETIQCYLAIHKTARNADRIAEVCKNHVGVTRSKEVWAEVFGDCGWEVPRILDAMLNSDEAGNFYQQDVAQIKTDIWSKGRIVLLGDAAHCPTPLTGLGTSLAIVGAYVLAGELAGRTHMGKIDVEPALQAYDKVLRPLVSDGQRVKPGVIKLVYPVSVWGRWIFRAVVRLLSLIRIGKLGEWFGNDDVGKWKLPHYPALEEKN